MTAATDGRPVAFSWSGVPYEVETMEEIRQPNLDWWTESPAHRTYYLVTTNRGHVVELLHDETSGEWGVAPRLDYVFVGHLPVCGLHTLSGNCWRLWLRRQPCGAVADRMWLPGVYGASAVAAAECDGGG